MSKWIVSILIPFVTLLCGCVASSNFHTGRTLEETKIALAFGADDIITKSNDKYLTISKGRPCVLSFGLAYGLPFRFETALRYYPTEFLEASLRYQINPRSFTIFDCSLNCSYARFFGGYSYLKYGISISKNIHEYEPYIHYSFYHKVGSTEGDFSGGFISGLTGILIDNSLSIGLGVALPFHTAKILPEIDYQYFGTNVSHGIWHFGIGFRTIVN